MTTYNRDFSSTVYEDPSDASITIPLNAFTIVDADATEENVCNAAIVTLTIPAHLIPEHMKNYVFETMERLTSALLTVKQLEVSG